MSRLWCVCRCPWVGLPPCLNANTFEHPTHLKRGVPWAFTAYLVQCAASGGAVARAQASLGQWGRTGSRYADIRRSSSTDSRVALHQEDFAAQTPLQRGQVLAFGHDLVVAGLSRRWGTICGAAPLAWRTGRHAKVAVLWVTAEVGLKPGNGRRNRWRRPGRRPFG